MKIRVAALILLLFFLMLLATGCLEKNTDLPVQANSQTELDNNDNSHKTNSSQQKKPEEKPDLFFALVEGSDHNLNLYDSHGTEVQKELNMPTYGIHRIALSPNRTKMAVVFSNKVHPDKQGIYIYDFKTRKLKQVANDKNAFLLSASCVHHNDWSPDSTKLLFEVHHPEVSEPEQDNPEPKPILSDVNVYNVKTGEIKHVFTYMYRLIGDIDPIWWTKDSTGIYYLSWYSPSIIKKIDISTGNTSIVFDQEESTVLLSAFAEDYNQLWVANSDNNEDIRDNLYTIDLEKGTIKKSFTDANNLIEPIYAHSDKVLLKKFIKENHEELLYILNSSTNEKTDLIRFSSNISRFDEQGEFVLIQLGYSNPKTLIINLKNNRLEN